MYITIKSDICITYSLLKISQTFHKKMKRFPSIFLITLSLLISISCSNKKTYSELLDEQDATIQAYIQRNSFNVIKITTDTLPANALKGEKDYYLMPSGLYFHIVTEGDKSVKVASRTKVALRYRPYTLTSPADTLANNSNTIASTDPFTVTYGETSTFSVVGIHQAIGLMRYSGSEAKVIVPASLNTGTYSDQVIPVAYDLKIKIVK